MITDPPFSEHQVNDDLLPELIRRLARAEADLRAVLPAEIDAFIDPVTGSPILLREAQKALQESETRYRQQADELDAIFLAMTDAIIVYSAAGNAVQANPAMIAILGFNPVGLTITEVYTGVSASHTDGSPLRVEEYPTYQALRGKLVVEKPFSITNATDYRKIFVLASASPLFDHDKVSGVVAIWHDVTERKLAEQAIYSAQVAEHEQRIFADALRDITLTHINSTDRDVVLKRILDNVGRVVPHDSANIMLLRNDMLSIVLSSGQTPSQSAFDRRPVSLKEVPSFSQITLTGEALVISDTRSYPEWIDLRGDNFVRSYVSSPIRVHGQIFGFLNLDSATPGFFTTAHAERLQAFADEAAIAIENAQLYDQLLDDAFELGNRVEQRTQELQATKDRVESILNNTSDAILLLNDNLAIEQSNPAFNALFGYRIDEVFNQPLTFFAEPDMVETVNTMVQQVLQSRKPARMELLAFRKDHSTFSADIAMSAIKVLDMTASGVICSVRDNSSQKRLEEELRGALDQEKELGELKSRLVSMASHEFRTPLTTILSSGGLIELYLKQLPTMTQWPLLDKHFRKIETSVQRMTNLLDDVLTIGKGDAGLLAFKPQLLDLHTFCQTLVQDIQLAATPEHSVIFSQIGSCEDIYMDKDLLQHILVNLLTNAIKYSPAGGKVLFEATCEQGSVIFRVKDEGLGIPEKDQGGLFEPFHRAANVGNISGTGLGLAIVKRAVTAHHGTISFDSHVGVGTTFTVAIPIFEEVSQ